MNVKRRSTMRDLRAAIKNIDNVLGCYHEALHLVNVLMNDGGLTNDDLIRLKLANNVLEEFDIHGIVPALKFLSSTDKAMKMSNHPAPNEEEENDNIRKQVERFKNL